MSADTPISDKRLARGLAIIERTLEKGRARAIADDKQFFQRHPGKSYRRRAVVEGEFPGFAIVELSMRGIEDFHPECVEVHQERPGLRTRTLHADTGTEFGIGGDATFESKPYVLLVNEVSKTRWSFTMTITDEDEITELQKGE